MSSLMFFKDKIYEKLKKINVPFFSMGTFREGKMYIGLSDQSKF